jgi:hypothetical protein
MTREARMSWLLNEFYLVVKNPAPILSGIISGLFTLGAAWFITSRFNRSIKQAEFVLGFTQRYHAILGEKHKLNQAFISRRHGNRIVDSELLELERNDAIEIYRELFSLLFDEYFAFRRHLLDEKVFCEWMKWRRDDWNEAVHKFRVGDMQYKTGWKLCKEVGPIKEHPFAQFIDNVHGCSNYKAVQREVWFHGPCLLARIRKKFRDG